LGGDMMRTEKIQDERIIAQRRKIGSDAFQILFYGLILSVLIQQYMFNAPFSQYVVEVVLLLTVSIYIVIRNLIAGNDLFTSGKAGNKLVIINSLVCGLAVAVVNTTLNYIKFGDLFKTDIVNTLLVSFVTFLSSSIFAFAVFEILYILNKKKQMKIELSLKDEDEE
jgi:cell shape-determining protein MreD